MNHKHAGLIPKFVTEPINVVTNEIQPSGWFVHAWYSSRPGRPSWRPYLPLRYLRKRDCELACEALVRAGIDTAGKMVKAGTEKVKRVAAEAYQW